jgi:hypothetical protein
MSVFKPFLSSDIILVPFEVNKEHTYSGSSELIQDEIERYLGVNINSTIYISGSNQTGVNTPFSQELIYNSIKQLYYTNFINSPSSSEAFTSSIQLDGTITGSGGTQQPMYDNYLSSTLLPYRNFPKSVNDNISIISIPSNIFGEKIEPSTVTINFTSSSIEYNITDDGEGNMIYSGSNVGNIIYEHGLIILNIDNQTNQEIISSNNLYLNFKGAITIYENQFKCTIRENEFNFSNNPTLLSGSGGDMYEFATKEYFSPYITTVGLYNNNKELIAVAKLAQPLPSPNSTDINILINLDM